jgi:hypothetical protein
VLRPPVTRPRRAGWLAEHLPATPGTMAHSTDGPPDRTCLEITTVPTTNLDTGGAVELLQIVDDWLGTDPGKLGASLGGFVGNLAYGLDELRHDLNRFIFLLGGNDGEPLFQPGHR